MKNKTGKRYISLRLKPDLHYKIFRLKDTLGVTMNNLFIAAIMIEIVKNEDFISFSEEEIDYMDGYEEETRLVYTNIPINEVFIEYLDKKLKKTGCSRTTALTILALRLVTILETLLNIK